jgi:Baseplate J-like protein
VLPSLSQLVATVTASNSYQVMLTIANQLGLTTSAWAPLGMARTILATMSQVVSASSSYVNLVAQGGYATTAAAMVDSNGNPITTWMDLVSSEVYGNTRIAASPASGVIVFANAQSIPYGPFPIGSLHLKNPLTLATYSNTLSTEQIYGNAGSTIPFNSTVHFAADAAYSGSNGSAIDGTQLVLTTPLAGVTTLPLGTSPGSSSMVGTNAETNQALLTRDQDKLGSISPNGAGSALEYIATTPSIVAAFGAVSATVTRAQEILVQSTGVVTLYIANSAGPSTSPDCTIVQAAEQFWAVPTGMTLQVVPAVTVYIAVRVTIYVMGSAGLIGGINGTASQAVQEFFSLVPVGGLYGSLSTGEVSLSSISAAIQSVAPLFITELQYASPSGPTALAVGQVPVLDPSSTFTVVVVPFA